MAEFIIIDVFNHTNSIINGPNFFNPVPPHGTGEAFFSCLTTKPCKLEFEVTFPCSKEAQFLGRQTSGVIVSGSCPNLELTFISKLPQGVIPVKSFGINLLGPAVKVSGGRRC